MGRIIRADTIRLGDFINLDYTNPLDALHHGRRGWVTDIDHFSRDMIEVTLVRAEAWPVSPAARDVANYGPYLLALSNHAHGADVVWRK